jgi:uncharacterized membrane protein YdjX (TVP38/TMEM64 family)
MTEHQSNPGDVETPGGPTGPPEPERSLGEIFRRLGPAGYLALAWAALPALGGFLLLANISTVSAWLVDHRALGFVLYIVIFVFSAGFGLLPTYAQAFLGGWAFGLVGGFPAALAGFVGASMVGYLAGRTASADRAERLIEENRKARAVRDALIGRGFWKTLGMVTLLRLPPNSPFALMNLVMASTGVSKRAFVLGTAIGMSPRTALAVYLASGLRDVMSADALSKEDVAAPMWMKISGLVAAVVVFGVIAWIGDRAVKRATRGAGEPVTEG